jgi:hypothetical protein
MATQEDLRAIAGKALADEDFRQKLIEDPEAAVKEAGIELSGEQMKALKEMDKEQLEAGLADLDERLTMGCWGKANYPVGGSTCFWE